MGWCAVETRLFVLKRFVEALGLELDVQTLDDRKALQKAVYLGQAIGKVDLGYRFGWYVRGPYSPKLTEDYFAAAEEAEAETDNQGRGLAPTIVRRLDGVKKLIAIPPGVELDQPSWLEALASWHFLTSVSKLSDNDAEQTLKQQKPHLYDYWLHAREALAHVQPDVA